MADFFAGFIALESTVAINLVTRNGSNTPIDADATPTFRVYGPTAGPTGPLSGGTGTAALLDSGSITGATNASPIVITSAGHGLNTGTRLTVASVGGNTAANGDFTITKIDADTFSLDGSTGNGAYTSGGTWHVAGLYQALFVASAANGCAAGQTYTMVVSYAISGTTKADYFSFTVV